MNRLQRRQLVLATGALLASPLGRAQQPGRHYRVGVICSFGPLTARQYLDVLRNRLATHGYVEGRNLVIEPKFAQFTNALDRAQTSTAELLATNVDAIFSLTTVLTLGARAATSTVPIVFVWVADPLSAGIVKDLRNPGANVTGVTNRHAELTVKRLELLKELVPDARRVAVLAWTFDAAIDAALRSAQPVAESLGIEIVRLAAPYAFASAVQSALAADTQAMLVENSLSLFWVQDHSRLLVDQALHSRFPVIHIDHAAVDMGGLISYAPSPFDTLRRGADLLARVLNGEPTATLPVDGGAEFHLEVNLKTARAIALEVPAAIVSRANRVIE